MWQYINDQQEWKNYADEDNVLLENLHKLGKRKAKINNFSFDSKKQEGYQIHFEKKYQRNLKTGTKREIRRKSIMDDDEIDVNNNNDEYNLFVEKEKDNVFQKNINVIHNKWKTVNASDNDAESDDEEKEKISEQQKEFEKNENQYMSRTKEKTYRNSVGYLTYDIQENDNNDNNGIDPKKSQNMQIESIKNNTRFNRFNNDNLLFSDRNDRNPFATTTEGYHSDGYLFSNRYISETASICSYSTNNEKNNNNMYEETIRRFMELLNLKDKELNECYKRIHKLEQEKIVISNNYK